MTQDETLSLQVSLSRLPWWRDLTEVHQKEMLAEIHGPLSLGELISKDVYSKLLKKWSFVAQTDQKWARFEILRTSGLFKPRKLD